MLNMVNSSENLEEDEAYPLRCPVPFDHKHYVPRLLWKRGEYDALLNLHAISKFDVTPLIDIPEISYDFEAEEEPKTIDDHLTRFGKRFGQKWSELWAFVDLKLINSAERMKDGRHPLKFIFDEVRLHNGLAIPTTGIDRDADYQQAVRDTMAIDGSGACIRLTTEDLTSPEFQNQLFSLLQTLDVAMERCHLILDLGAPGSFEPIEGFTKMVVGLIEKIPELNSWMTYTVIGTAFPKTLSNLGIGVHYFKRYEWLFYKQLLKTLASTMRRPSFGDYAIVAPAAKPAKPVNPRYSKTPAYVRYTIDNDRWFIAKGGNVRAPNGSKQYSRFCSTLIKAGLFLGSNFSEGGRFVQYCSRHRVKGDPTKWIWVGTNHHIEKAVFDLANLNGS